MKRMLFILLAAALLLCGCTAAMTPEKIMLDASKNMEALDALSGRMQLRLDFEDGETSISVPVALDFSAEGLQSGNLRMAGLLEADELRMEIYREGEWTYTVVGDEKYRVKDTDSDMLSALPELLIPAQNDLWEKAEVIVREEDTLIRIRPTDAQFQSLYGSLAELAAGFAGNEISNLAFGNAEIEFAVEAGYVRAGNLSFTLTGNAGGSQFSAAADVTLLIRDPQQPVTVKFPEGYRQFPELGAEA